MPLSFFAVPRLAISNYSRPTIGSLSCGSFRSVFRNSTLIVQWMRTTISSSLRLRLSARATKVSCEKSLRIATIIVSIRSAPVQMVRTSYPQMIFELICGAWRTIIKLSKWSTWSHQTLRSWQRLLRTSSTIQSGQTYSFSPLRTAIFVFAIYAYRPHSETTQPRLNWRRIPRDSIFSQK